jgi:hypothetical protein
MDFVTLGINSLSTNIRQLDKWASMIRGKGSGCNNSCLPRQHLVFNFQVECCYRNLDGELFEIKLTFKTRPCQVQPNRLQGWVLLALVALLFRMALLTDKRFPNMWI